MQALPWQGPIVIVVYRLRSSMESNPSMTAFFSSLFVTSMQRQANCLPSPAPTSGGRTTGSCSAAASARSARSARRRRGPRARSPPPARRTGPARPRPRASARRRPRPPRARSGAARRQERLRRLVERELGAGHREQVRRGRLEPRDDHEVAGDLSAPLVARGPDDDLADAATPLRRHDRGAGDHRGPSTGRASGAGRRPSRRRPPRGARGRSRTPRARGQHHRPPAREHAVALDEQLDRRREHHARQVVVREHRRLLDGAGREHQVPRPDPVEAVAVRGRDQRTRRTRRTPASPR